MLGSAPVVFLSGLGCENLNSPELGCGNLGWRPKCRDPHLATCPETPKPLQEQKGRYGVGGDPRGRRGGPRVRRGGPRGGRGGPGAEEEVPEAEGEVSGAEEEVPGTGRKFLADLCWADS